MAGKETTLVQFVYLAGGCVYESFRACGKWAEMMEMAARTSTSHRPTCKSYLNDAWFAELIVEELFEDLEKGGTDK